MKNGIMLLDDLKHIFKSSTAVALSAKSYIVNLLNKFEVTIRFNCSLLYLLVFQELQGIKIVQYYTTQT